MTCKLKQTMKISTARRRIWADTGQRVWWVQCWVHYAEEVQSRVRWWNFIMKGGKTSHTNSPLNHTGFYTNRLKVISPPVFKCFKCHPKAYAIWPKGLHEVIFDCLVPSISPGCPAKLIFSKISSKSESSDSSYLFFFLKWFLESLFRTRNYSISPE